MTQELLIARGLPASGKSTFAVQWVAVDPENRVRVNRDDLRMELFGTYVPEDDGKVTAKQKEQKVTEVEHVRIEKALRQGKSVVVDNTNLHHKTFSTYGKIAKRMLVPLTHRDFPIEIDEALRRNALRERKVPEEVIRSMQRRYTGPDGSFHLFPGDYPTKPFQAPTERRRAVIFDADGTLVDVRGIRSYMEGKFRDFDGFHRASLWSPPISDVVALAKRFHEEGYAVIVTTAREDKYRDVTQKWLDDNGVPYENIYMRKSGDQRKDGVVKQEILAEIQKHYDIVHAVDDRDEVLIEAWQAAGITTTRVPGLRPGEDGLDFKITIEDPFSSGRCLRCGRPLSNGALFGPRCARVR